MPARTNPIAIVGAGPAGLCAAIALHSQGIPCEIYESREDPSKNIRNYNGALFIMANGAKTLDELGIYDDLKSRGVILPQSAMRNPDNTIRSISDNTPDKKAGYGRLRLGRRDLHMGLLELVQQRNIPVHVGKSFKRVISEGNDATSGVSFETEDGGVVEARLLLGADGIYSKVRAYLAPEIEPEFTGTTLLGSLIHKSELRYPEDVDGEEEYYLPTFMYGDPGVYALIPQGPDEDGADLLLFTQHHSSKDSDLWRSLRADSKKMVEHMSLHRDHWPDPVRSAIDLIDESKMVCWPIHTLPNLPFWASKTNNIILIGDAAHAVDPASAQGVNQAFEDGYALALLLKFGYEQPEKLHNALQHWLHIRHKRLDLVAELARINQNMRKPASERQPNNEERLLEVREELLTYDCSKEIGSWIEKQSK